MNCVNKSYVKCINIPVLQYGMLYVYLGRFSPFHEGHKMLLTKLINKFGIENCLVLIGSSNVLNERTPFKFETRKKMILKDFPDVKILPFADVDNDVVWLNNIKKLEKKLGQKFIFYGGSAKDLEVLSKGFETHVFIDRFTEGKGISGTQIRRSLISTDLDRDIDST